MSEPSNGPSTTKELEDVAAARRLHFARHCWIKRKQMHHCNDGKDRTWNEIFYILEGITLGEYAAIKIKEKEDKSQQT